MHAREQQSPEMRECLEECMACHFVCLEMIEHCLAEGGAHATPAHIRILTDCAEMCLTSADFMLRGSSMHIKVCGVCADVCERCAEDCARYTDDEYMQQCALICLRCAQSCRRMAMLAAAA